MHMDEFTRGDRVIICAKGGDFSGFSAAIYAADILRFAADLRLDLTLAFILTRAPVRVCLTEKCAGVILLI